MRQETNSGRWTRAGVAAVTVAAALAMSSSALAAPPLENDHYESSDSGSSDECGYTIESEFTTRGHFMVREVAGSDGQAYLAHDNFRYREVLTNPETGAFFVVRANVLSKEMSGRQVDGNLWEFTSQESGQSFVVEDSNGKVVLRESGRLTFRSLFDTLGDGQPGGELIERELTSISGPHPGLFVDFCEIATELIGPPLQCRVVDAAEEAVQRQVRDSGIVVEVGKAVGDKSTLWLIYDQASTLAVNGCAPCNPTNKQLAPYYLEWGLDGQALVLKNLRARSGFDKDMPEVNNYTLKSWKQIN